DERLPGEGAVHLLLSLLERVDERDAARSAALPGIRGAERALEELVDRGRARGFLRRAIALAPDLAGLDGEGDDRSDDDEKDRGCRRERDAMPGDELADLIRGA